VISRTLRRALLFGAAAALPFAAVTSAEAASSPGWRVVATISSPTQPTVGMTGIDASGPGNAWAVGTTFQSLVVEHWLAGKWRPVAAPAGTSIGSSGGGVNDNVIGTSSAANTWLFPDVNNVYSAFRWNGTAWTKFKLTGAADISATAVSGPGDVWAFGAKAAPPNSPGFGPPYAAHYNGRVWRQVSMPGVPLVVSRVSGSDIWAVGPTAATASKATWVWIAMHWDGRSWHTLSLPKLAPVQGYSWYPDAVAALSTSNVWVSEVVSGPRNGNPGPSGTTLLHWNGKRWSRVSEDASVRAAGAVPDGHGGLWLTSMNADFTASDLIHYSGGHWTSQAAPSRPGDTTLLYPGAMVRIPGTTSLWAAGQLENGNSQGAGVILKDGS
jgi:hypothetical protein